MNENNILEPHESILLMTNSSNGKSVHGTRVFKSFDELRDAYPTMRFVAKDPWVKVGDVVSMGHVNKGSWKHPKSKVGMDFVVKVAQTGYEIECQPYGTLYISSSTKAPVRFALKPEHFGYPAYKEKTSYKKAK